MKIMRSTYKLLLISPAPLRVPGGTKKMFNKHYVDVNSGKAQLFKEETISEFIIPNDQLKNSHEKPRFHRTSFNVKNGVSCILVSLSPSPPLYPREF